MTARKLPPRYFILLITVVMQTAASLPQQGIGALQPFIGQRLSLDHQHLGLIVAAVSAGAAAFSALAGLAVDYFGERAVLLWSGVAMGAALCASALVPSLVWAVVWLFVFGMFYGTSSPGGGRAILLWFTRDRGFAMGIRQTGVPLGGVAGSLLLPPVAIHWGYQAALATAGILCALLTVVSVQGYERPHDEAHAEALTIGEVWRGMLLVASSPSSICLNLTCSTLVAAQYAALGFLAIALITLKGAPLTIAVAAMALFQLGAVVGRLVWGTISDRVFGGDRMAPMLLISGVTFATLLWLAKSGAESTAVVWVLAFTFGFSAAAWNGLWAAAQAEIGGHRHAGSALGAALTLIYLVGAVEPPLFGALVDRTNFTLAWQVLAAIVAAGVVPGFFARHFLLRLQHVS